jgi:hypothetical protein
VKVLLRYQPGQESALLPGAPGLLSSEPYIYRVGFDATPDEVLRSACQVIRLNRARQNTVLLLPFYASRALYPRLQRYVANLPFARPQYSREITKLLGDAQGHVNPALFEHYQIFSDIGLPPHLAAFEAYRAWAPEVLSPLRQFVGPLPDMLQGYELVRKWEVRLKNPTPWCRTGREFLDFACNFGCVRREGRGRLRWAPVYARAISYLTSIPDAK